jgi:hypothetical protein
MIESVPVQTVAVTVIAQPSPQLHGGVAIPSAEAKTPKTGFAAKSGRAFEMCNSGGRGDPLKGVGAFDTFCRAAEF